MSLLGPALVICLLVAVAGPGVATALAASAGEGERLGATRADAGADAAAARAAGERRAEEEDDATEAPAGAVARPERPAVAAPQAPDRPGDEDAERPTDDQDSVLPVGSAADEESERPSGGSEGDSASGDLGERIRGDVRRRTGAIGENVRRRVGVGSDDDEPRRAGANSPGADEKVVVTADDDYPPIRLLPGNNQIYVGNRALIRGYETTYRAGRTVVLEVRTGGRWVAVDEDVTEARGKFYLAWYPQNTGRYRVRVRPRWTGSAIPPSNPRLLYIYRERVASWYGPGFYGNTTACGQTFSSRLLGVAHRSLPCGYRVTVRYNGRYRTVPVVDRGPYVSGRHYDLTEALRNYLDFDGVDEIWATA